MKVTYDPKPIPERRFDYCATPDGYEPGDPVGYGATEAEAVRDLTESSDDEGGFPPQRCEKSPTGFCEFDGAEDALDTDCIHCGLQYG